MRFSALVEPPSLLLKNAEPLKLPACVGVKATCTDLPWRMFKLKGLPLTTLKGAAAVTLPLSVNCPRLNTEKNCVRLWPTMTGPKSRLEGPVTSLGGRLVTTM